MPVEGPCTSVVAVRNNCQQQNEWTALSGGGRVIQIFHIIKNLSPLCTGEDDLYIMLSAMILTRLQTGSLLACAIRMSGHFMIFLEELKYPQELQQDESKCPGCEECITAHIITRSR